MKKIILISILFISLFSNQELEIKKTKAVDLYKSGDYESAYQILSTLYMTVLSDTNINFMLGRSAYETGRYKIALASFERVQMLDSTNIRNQLEIARTQHILELYEDAKLNFKKVLNNSNIPDNARTNIEIFLKKTTNKLEKSFFFFNFSVGLIYDSNVNYGAINNTYSLPYYGEFTTVDSKSDSAYEFKASAMNVYDIGDKNGYSIRNKISIYNRTYNKQYNYDITYLSYSPTLLYQDIKNIYELNFIFENMRLNNDNYLNIYSIMPNIIHKLDATTRLVAHVKYAKKSYQRSFEEGRDASNYELSFSYQRLWSSSYLILRGLAEYERKDDGYRNDVDYNRYKLIFDYVTQFYPTYIARVDVEISTKGYQDRNNLFQNTREDNGYKTGLNITKKFSSDFYLEGKFSYERFWSNQSIYAYDKQIFSLSINKNF